MGISVSYVSQLTVVETASGAFVSSDDNTITTRLNTTTTLNSGTTPAATKYSAFTKALSGGAGTIDLTSLSGSTPSETVSFSTLKVRAFKFQNPGSNAITVTPGASNGLNLLGADFTLVIPAGGEVLMTLNAGSVTVDNTHKTLDLAGTGTDTLNVELIAG